MQKILYYFGLVCIALWLFTVHTKFAFALDPLNNNESGFYEKLFRLAGYDFKIAIPYIWGLSFSVATIVIIALLKKTERYFWLFAISIAVSELLGVLLFNYPDHSYFWMKLASIYYGIYSFIMVLLYIYISYHSSISSDKISISNESIEDKIRKLLKSGMKGSEIAMKLNTSESKVSRIKKKLIK